MKSHESGMLMNTSHGSQPGIIGKGKLSTVVVCFDPARGSADIGTGGDDHTWKAWDLRTDLRSPLFENKRS